MARRRKANPRPAARRKNKRKPSWLRRIVVATLLLVLAAAAGWTLHLDQMVRTQFEGKRWAVPATVYARPLELYVGLFLTEAQLRTELDALNYRPQPGASAWGTWDRDGSYYVLSTRAFSFWDGHEPARRIRLRIADGVVSELADADSGDLLPLVRLDPATIGHIYPAHREDRLLVRLEDVPPTLIAGLLAMEDNEFYRHFGVSISGIARAALANLRAGRIVQGGSTLTQQLVKNFFLTHEQTFLRKINEAVMAMLLEVRYSKDEILETYINEVFLVLDGERFIHGFGLASQHLFGQPLETLSIDQQALLIALNRGPQFYNVHRNPQRAQDRRDLVLTVMQRDGIVSAAQAEEAIGQPLGVVPTREGPRDSYPAFLDLVQRDLQRDYRREDLQSEGLRIFTTLSPTVQAATEAAIARQLETLGSELQAAAIVTTIDSGEVLALVGGRDPRFPGFNRALDARRPIGSLIKPAVFLATLEQPERFGLGTVLDDSPLVLEIAGSQPWAPRNFDNEFRGPILLVDALAQSRNLPTIHAGLDVGLPAVQSVMQRLGVPLPTPLYPSYLIGTSAYTPLEVAQMYQTLASGGFRTPLRAVRAVTQQNGTPLRRYALSTVRVFDPEPVHLVNTALVAAMREGTGQGAYRFLPASLTVAGKTGTTDQGRDSWFAGFAGDLLGVVWVGRDDNGVTGLSGSSGALPVWSDALATLQPRPLTLFRPAGIASVHIDRASGLLAGPDCPTGVELPYIRGQEPQQSGTCGMAPPALPQADTQPPPTGGNWFQRLFQ